MSETTLWFPRRKELSYCLWSCQLLLFIQVLTEHQAECEPLLRLLDEYENDKSKNSVFINPLPAYDPLPYTDDENNTMAKKVGGLMLVLLGECTIHLFMKFD